MKLWARNKNKATVLTFEMPPPDRILEEGGKDDVGEFEHGWFENRGRGQSGSVHRGRSRRCRQGTLLLLVVVVGCWGGG